MPYPAGAIVFHSDGIAKALGLGIVASLPLLLGISQTASDGNSYNGDNNYNTEAVSEPTVVVDDEDWEMADVEDLTSGEFDI